MASSDKHPIFLTRKDTSEEFKFRETKTETLNWFYHVLAIEFRLEERRVKRVIRLLSAWDINEDYDFSVLQEIDHYFSNYPLLAMAFNVIIDSKKTFIRLKVPFTSTIFLNYFMKNYNSIRELDNTELTQLYVTRQVERNAMKESRFRDVLCEFLTQEDPNKTLDGDLSAETYGVKLVVFYGYSENLEYLMNIMRNYRESRDPKSKTPTKTEPKTGDEENLRPVGKSAKPGDKRTATSPGTTGSDPKQFKFDESDKREFSKLRSPEKPTSKKVRTPEQKFIRNLCKLLQMDNRSLLQELKDHVWRIDKIVDKVLKLMTPEDASDTPS